MTVTTTSGEVTTHAVLTLSAMRNQIRDYDWGSQSALAMLQGRAPSGRPEAELWMGAHPGAPSQLLSDDGEGESLLDLITRLPEAVLGTVAYQRFGARLPFMLKVLAITRPLSVQVHPDAARAKKIYKPGGGSPYVDSFHKPEMLYALEPIEALFGFRTPAQAAMLIRRLGCERLTALVDALDVVDTPGVVGSIDSADDVGDSAAESSGAGAGPDVVDLSSADPQAGEAARLHAALTTLIRWPLADRAGLVAEIAAASRRLQASGNTDYPEAFGWVDRLVGLHPADPMVLAPLLLDLVRLSPGQTVFVPAGVPHCYLIGMGVEVLAASDNVLRCGLTSKPVEVEELLEVIDCRPQAYSGTPVTTLSEHEIVWRPNIDDFQLSRIVVDDEAIVADGSIDGPQILLCTRGKVQIQVGSRTVQLTSGYSAFVSDGAGPLTLSGSGDVFRAAIGTTD